MWVDVITAGNEVICACLSDVLVTWNCDESVMVCQSLYNVQRFHWDLRDLVGWEVGCRGRDTCCHGSRLLWKSSMGVIMMLLIDLMCLCHKWPATCSMCEIQFVEILRRVPHVGQEMLTPSGTPDLTPLLGFSISPVTNFVSLPILTLPEFDYIYQFCQL